MLMQDEMVNNREEVILKYIHYELRVMYKQGISTILTISLIVFQVICVISPQNAMNSE